MPPVSIIATVLNEAEDIPRLVASLLAQQPPAAEIILVDGGSTDGTWEWLEQAARQNPLLRPVRNESCSLKRCPGPIARGRNVAITAATSPIIACADAGCAYPPDWMAQLTAPIAAGTAQYALGGSRLDLADPTVWDLATAPFFGVKLAADAPSKSCTARSMAFTRELWQRIGGFPETVLMGEDTLFDLQARSLTKPAFVAQAKAIYRPQNSLASACRQLARYAVSDGILGVRFSRLFRNGSRCLLQVLGPALLPWSVLPLLAVLAMQCWLAFRPEFRFLCRCAPQVWAARFLFSLLVPWIVTFNQLRGGLTNSTPVNPQNR